MSEGTSNRKLPKLKDLMIVLRDLIECHDLGLQLGLPESTLRLIDSHPVEDHLRIMLSEWLQYDPEASWKKLATALSKIGKNAIAANIRREFMNVDAPSQFTTNMESASLSQLSLAVPVRKRAPEEEGKGPADEETRPLDIAKVEQDATKCQEMAKIAFRKIKSDFSILVSDVQSSMEDHEVKVKRVRRFILEFCDGNCSIPKENDLDIIFDTITEARLWRYDHYGLLEELAEKFLPEDDPARAQVTEYKRQLTGFYATTRIIDFVKLNELEDREEISYRPFSPKKYNNYYQMITVKLRLDRDILSELTLEYVDKLWKALAKEFHLPSLTVIMDKIVKGSLRIAWLVLPQVIEKIRATYFKSVEFFQQHNIINICLYDGASEDAFCPDIYDEELIIIGSTPLFRASFAGNIDEVKTLLEGGANVNETNDNSGGYTPLMGACITGQADIATLLLEHKATVDYQTKRGTSALSEASMYGHTAIVILLLDHGAQVDLGEVTALMSACLAGSVAIVRVLLEYGANVDHCNEDGMSALMFASVADRKEIVEVLLEYKAQVNLVNKDGVPALAWVLAFGHTDIARLLLENRATMDFEDEILKEVLYKVSKRGFSEVLSIMLEHGTPVDLIVRDDNTALGAACKKGQAETAKVLLNHGANLDYQNKDGQSAVHLASMGGHTETLKVLIEKAPQFNLQDKDDWTPLLYAVKQGHLEVIKLLLEHGAAVDIESKSGLTALRLAQSGAHRDVCDILLQYTLQGAKVIHAEQEESESRQEEETKADLTKEQRESDTQGESAKVEYQQQGADDDSQQLPAEDTQQKRRESEKEKEGGTNRQQQETELTEAQKAEVRSVGERIWEQIKRVLLRERVEKELAAQMRREQGTSELILEPAKERRSFLNRLVARIGQRTPRRGHGPVVGTAPVPECNY